MPETAPEDNLERARRRGRRVGIVVFSVFVSGITLVWSAQIVSQVWAKRPSPTTQPCRTGLISLIGAIERARSAAAAQTGGERAALTRFRQQLAPEWLRRETLEAECRDDPAAARALRQIDELRYAEEHAVRHESIDLAARRRRVKELRGEILRSGISGPAPHRE
jgi:hypothetical protein